VVDIEDDFPALVVPDDVRSDVVHECRHIYLLDPERGFASFDLRDVQEILDQAFELVGLVVDSRQRLFRLFCRCGADPAHERSGEALHDREGSAELVTDHRHEVSLALCVLTLRSDVVHDESATQRATGELHVGDACPEDSRRAAHENLSLQLPLSGQHRFDLGVVQLLRGGVAGGEHRRHAEELLRCRVDGGDRALVVYQDDGVGNSPDDRRELRFLAFDQ
jgi:hypothetical protein